MKYIFLILSLIAVSCSSFQEEKKQPDLYSKLGTTKTIVFIHGLYVTPLCWENWKTEFESKGYKVFAPSYPFIDADPSSLRKRHPDPKLASLDFKQLLQHYRDFIKTLPEKPILIGHSMGGLISQILLNEGIVTGAIAIDSVPPYGIVSEFSAPRHGLSFMRSAWPIISPFASDNEPIYMDETVFKTFFANRLEESKFFSEYQKHIVPASRRVPRGSLTEASKIDFSKKRGPLLLISGEDDKVVPPSVVRLNFKEYNKEVGLSEYKEFPGRSHFIIAEKGWQELVEFSLKWIDLNR
jgi:pimeloyl-ACP methyl ester carboxylesterase